MKSPDSRKVLNQILTIVIVVSTFLSLSSAANAENTLNTSNQTIPTSGSIKPIRVLNGVCAHVYDLRSPYFSSEKYFSEMEAAGIKWVRVDISQPKYSWEFEPFLLGAHEHGIKVLAILGPFIVGSAPNFTLSDWNAAVQDTMNIFGGRVDAWEIWNEPNIKTFQIGYMNGSPVHYFEMVKSAYTMIKNSTSNSSSVLIGSLAGDTDCGKWLKQFWELGVEKYCDAFSLHIYDITRDSIICQVANITSPKPIWITEIGADSLDYGLNGQVQMLSNELSYLNSNCEKYRIQNSFVYCWMDYAVSGNVDNVWGRPISNEDFFGLLSADLIPKPAFDTYRSFVERS